MTQARLYHVSDADFITSSGESIKVIGRNHSAFVDYYPNFTPETLDELSSLLDEALTIPSDNVFVSIQAKATRDVNVELEDCARFFQLQKFEIKTIFSDQEFVWSEFGFDDYYASRRSAKRMFLLLTDMHSAAFRHRNALFENGWNDGRIDEILKRRDRLCMLMHEQRQCKFERQKRVHERVDILNKLYRKLSLYYEVGQQLFRKDKVVLDYLRFPKPKYLLKKRVKDAK